MSIEIQQDIVKEIAYSIQENWEKISLNLEIDSVHGEIVMSPKGKYFTNGEERELRLNIDITDLFEDLREKMSAGSGYWTICELDILSNGDFKFNFSYDEPERLAKLKRV